MARKSKDKPSLMSPVNVPDVTDGEQMMLFSDTELEQKVNTPAQDQSEVPAPKLSFMERNSNGLAKGIEYKLTDDGLIDWRALVPSKFLYIKNDPKIVEKLQNDLGKKIDEIDIEKDKVPDQYLVMTLGGIRYLAKLRGVLNVKEYVNECSPTYASVTCEVTYAPNIETENKSVQWPASASATLDNTSGFYQKYLVEAASNRAYARNVRSFLGINIVSKEELGADFPELSSKAIVNVTDPLEVLRTLSAQLNWSFESFRQKIHESNLRNIELNKATPSLKKKVIDGVENWKTWGDIPKDLIYYLSGKLKEYHESIQKKNAK